MSARIVVVNLGLTVAEVQCDALLDDGPAGWPYFCPNSFTHTGDVPVARGAAAAEDGWVSDATPDGRRGIDFCSEHADSL